MRTSFVMVAVRVLTIVCFSAFLLDVQVYGQVIPQPLQTYQLSRKITESVHLYWRFTEKTISFEVHGHTTGWVGIGFSSKGSMVEADIVVGWVKNGVATVTNRHGVSINSFPPLDPKQSLTSTSGKEVDGWTIISFTRDRTACNGIYDRTLGEGTIKIIWALGHADPSTEDLAVDDKHSSSDRGSLSLYLFHGNDSPNKTDFTGPEYQSFDITAGNITLPATTDTYYNCRIMKLPTLNKKHHIVRVEPLIEEKNIKNVHHMLTYICPRNFHPQGIFVNDWQCGDDIGVGAGGTPCTHLFTGWAVGGRAATFPDETGIPIGSNGESVYVRLETHYDNPDLQAGIVDSSGLRIIYTPNLRRFDTAITTVGQLYGGIYHYIPPGAQSFTTKTPCNTTCITSAMDSGSIDNITVHRIILHSHLAASKMKLRHFRDGKELPFILSDDNYDFEYQEYVPIDPYVIIKPGDELQTECTYNTEDRDYVTEGGEDTRNEMCFAFISYYPALDWDGCFSFTEPSDSLEYFGIEKISQNTWGLEGSIVEAPPSLEGKTLLEVVSEYNWTTQSISEFETFIHKKPKVQSCGLNSRHDRSIVSVIESDYPYIPPNQTCGSTITSFSFLLISMATAVYKIFACM